MTPGIDGAWYQWQGESLLLRLRVQPKARSDAFLAVHGERCKVRITAPPTDGKANAHLQQLLAQAFGVARNRVELEAGQTARDKVFRIRGPQTLPPDLPG